jgi:UTP--glucose-1-phosphate uridylyltransferase
MDIRKAVIPAAGLGRRFLPITKVIPKPMLPIVDRPTLHYLVDEAKRSGIEQIAIIVGYGRHLIQTYFSDDAQVTLIDQPEPRGSGHAVLMARSFVGDEPFAVLLGDIVIDSDPPCTRQLIDLYQQLKSPVLAVETLKYDLLSKHNAIAYQKIDEKRLLIHHIVEKPSRDVPSTIAAIGRYIFPPEIFSVLAETPLGLNGEIQLTDAINGLLEKHRGFGLFYTGKRYDIGDKRDYVMANLEFALKSQDYRDDLLLSPGKLTYFPMK